MAKLTTSLRASSNDLPRQETATGGTEGKQMAGEQRGKVEGLINAPREDKPLDPTILSIFKSVLGKGVNIEADEREIMVAMGGEYICYNERGLTVGVGACFDAEYEPEQLVDDLKRIIAKREALKALGYSAKINQANEIYEVVCHKGIDSEGLAQELETLRGLLDIQKK